MSQAVLSLKGGSNGGLSLGCSQSGLNSVYSGWGSVYAVMAQIACRRCANVGKPTVLPVAHQRLLQVGQRHFVHRAYGGTPAT